MRRLLVLAIALLALSSWATNPDLRVTKSGSNVILTWSGGTGPFVVLRSDHPSMTIRTVTLTGTTSPVTATGDKTDGAKLHCYIITDTSPATPTVALTTPAASFTSAAPCICASGTSTDASAVYCNTHAATGTTSWTACQNSLGVPLAVAADPHQSSAVVVTAAAVDAAGNWVYVSVSGTYTGTITDRTACVPRNPGM